MRVATRDRERAKVELILLPTVDVSDADVHDPAALAAFLHGADAAINLVGVLHSGSGSQSFEQAHVELARKVVEACERRGIGRLLHMSALQADPAGPSADLRSKGNAERIVRDSALAWTIFRPSVVFGRGDGFLNLFAALARLFPVLPLGCPERTLPAGVRRGRGPRFRREPGRHRQPRQELRPVRSKVYRLRELVEFVAAATGHQRPVIGLNDALSRLQAGVMGLLPVKLLTLDNYRSMQVDSVCDCEFPFGITPAALEGVALTYLGNRTPRARYQEMRERARRQAQGG